MVTGRGYRSKLLVSRRGRADTEAVAGTTVKNDTTARFAASRQLQPLAHSLIPGGAHTYAKGDDQFPVLSPGFIRSGSGCRVVDIDGNSFIEYGSGCRSVVLGHAHPESTPR